MQSILSVKVTLLVLTAALTTGPHLMQSILSVKVTLLVLTTALTTGPHLMQSNFSLLDYHHNYRATFDAVNSQCQGHFVRLRVTKVT